MLLLCRRKIEILRVYVFYFAVSGNNPEFAFDFYLSAYQLPLELSAGHSHLNQTHLPFSPIFVHPHPVFNFLGFNLLQ